MLKRLLLKAGSGPTQPPLDLQLSPVTIFVGPNNGGKSRALMEIEGWVMSQVARDAGLSRESLYKALSGDRSPGFDTILKVIGALGLKLHAEAGHG